MTGIKTNKIFNVVKILMKNGLLSLLIILSKNLPLNLSSKK